MSSATNDINRLGFALRVRMQRTRRVAVREGACLLGWTVLSWFALASANAATSVSGTIATNTTWVASQSPYIVSADVTVDDGALLTIQPDVIVTMNAGTNLVIKNGGLNAQGTSSAPITITSYRDVANPSPAPAPGDWGQLQFLSGTQAANTSLNYVTVKYGSGVVLTAASPTLNNLSVLNHNGPAISIDLNSSPTGTGLSASGNTLNGIVVPAGDITGSVSWGLQGIPYIVAQGIIGVGKLSIDLSPHSLTLAAGTSATLHVSVANAAPAEGLAIDVASSDTTVATVPATVTIAAGATSAAVAVNGQTAGNGTTTVTASRAGLGSASASVQVSGQPDLTLSNVSVGTIVKNSDASFNIPVTFTVNNVGGVAAQPSWYDLAYLSTNGVLDNASVNVSGNNQRTTALPAGASYTVTVTFKTSTTTAAGNYTLFIKTDGHGSQVGGSNTDNGFVAETNETNNTASTPITLSNLPDLVLSNVTLGMIVANANNTFSIPVTYTVTNNGSITAGPSWFDFAFLSSNGVLDTSAQALSGYKQNTAALAPGASYTATVSFTTSAVTVPGTYTLFVKTDSHSPYWGNGPATDNGNLNESNETNNVVGLPVTLNVDLVLSNVSLGTVAANANGTFNMPVTYTVTNAGAITAGPSWFDFAFLSSNGVLDTSAQALSGYKQNTVALAPGASYTATVSFITSAVTVPGTYTLFVKTDSHSPIWPNGPATDNGNLNESNETNNVVGLPMTLNADLVLSNVSLGTVAANANGTFNMPVTYTVTNAGAITAGPSWFDFAFLSSAGALDTSAQALSGYKQNTVALAPGASYTATVSFTTSAATVPGAYTLFVKTDSHSPYWGNGPATDNGNLNESNETNNVVGLPMTLNVDLVLSNVSLGTVTANANGTFSMPVTYTVTNAGAITAGPSWFDFAFLSSAGALDTSAQALSGYKQNTVALAPGASYTATVSFTTSAATVPGAYTLFVKTDSHSPYWGNGPATDNGNLNESNETNNVVGLPMTLNVDLVLSNVSLGTVTANANGTFSMPVTYTVTNAGAITAGPSWFDFAFLSSNGVLDTSAQALSGYKQNTVALAPGASYTATVSFTTSAATVPGAYTLFVKTDSHSPYWGNGPATDNGNLNESNETNNVVELPLTLPSH